MTRTKMFSLCFWLLAHLNSTLQAHSRQHCCSDLSPATWARGCGEEQGLPCALHGDEALAACEPTFPSPTQRPLGSFLSGSSVLFSQPAWPSRGWWVTHSALVLLYYFLHWPPCVSWPLIRVLGCGFLLFIVFFTLRCLLFLLPLCSLCSHYTLCSAVPYSHSIALFHVPNDCSSPFEKSLLKTHYPYIKEGDKDELAWLGEPGKYFSSDDESSLSWTLMFGIARLTQQQWWWLSKGAGFLDGSCAATSSGLWVTVDMILPLTLTAGCWDSSSHLSVLVLAHSTLAITTSLYQLWYCPFLAFHTFHCSVPSGSAPALPNLGRVEQMNLLPLGELRYHPSFVLFTGISQQPLNSSWPWPCLVDLDYPCTWCRTRSMGWMVVMWRWSAQALEFFQTMLRLERKQKNTGDVCNVVQIII